MCRLLPIDADAQVESESIDLPRSSSLRCFGLNYNNSVIASTLHLEYILRWNVIRISFLNVEAFHRDLPDFLNIIVVALRVDRKT
jgi:hypothetical protein